MSATEIHQRTAQLLEGELSVDQDRAAWKVHRRFLRPLRPAAHGFGIKRLREFPVAFDV